MDNLLNATSYYPCGPNGKPARITQYCTAYPPGSVLAVVESTSLLPSLIVPSTNAPVRLTQEINCPAGAYGSTIKYPVIVSFNGRTDCSCSIGSTADASCWFVNGATVGARVIAPYSPTLNITGNWGV